MAREIVLRRLSVQARTRSELAKTLASRQVPEEAASAVLDRFTELGLINDEAFSQAWVESRQQRRTLSRQALRHELRQRGVDSEIVTEAVDRVDDEAELSAARALAEKKQRSLQRFDPAVRRRRMAGALARRGFSGAVVARVLSELGGEESDLGSST